MKKFFFSVAALAAAMTFTACSSEDIISQEGGTPEWNEDGTGYITVGISLPADVASRATGDQTNDRFDDGLDTEYEVKNLTLLIFGGEENDETKAVFAGAYEIGAGAWTPSTDGQSGNGNENITVHRQVTTKISRMGGTHAYVLAVINHNGIFEVDGTELKVNGSVFTGTIADLQNYVITGKNTSENWILDNDGAKFHENGFLMLNAPLSSVKGGASAPDGIKVQVLSKIDRSQIKTSAADAQTAAEQGKVAAKIYVERAVAKVTMQDNNGTIDGVTDKNSNKVAWATMNWALDNTNRSSYLVRNTDEFTTWAPFYSEGATGNNKYRFVGFTEAEESGNFRTYFAKDPNYEAYEAESFNYIGDDREHAGTLIWKTTDMPAYCAENTFNVRQQVWGATTRVIIGAKLNGGNDFYASEGGNAIYDETGIKNVVLTEYMTQVQAWVDANKNYVGAVDQSKLTFTMTDNGKTATDKKPAFEALWAEGSFEFYDEQTIADNLNKQDFGGTNWETIINPVTLVYYTEAPAGWHTAASVTPYTLANVPAYSNNLVNAYVYANGVTYYESRIQHFGDDGCPWNKGLAWENPKPSVADGAYPGPKAPERYLGRWGVLRNNWYDLKVTKISKIGSALPPTLKGNERNTDDELDQYIAVDVNILSWAKRTQEVEF